jgi:N-acetyl-alpha-D-muramate 1-phosphate uridylyltransferase
LGDGSRFGLSIRYSMEGRDHGGALETAGGIAKALPWLGECFWVVSGDIFAPGFRFDGAQACAFAESDRLAHLWLVPNPPYHPRGDFGIGPDGLGESDPTDGPRHTYANLALMRADLCRHLPVGERAALGPLLHAAMLRRQISVQMYTGAWENVGTPAQWEALSAEGGSRPQAQERTR